MDVPSSEQIAGSPRVDVQFELTADRRPARYEMFDTRHKTLHTAELLVNGKLLVLEIKGEGSEQSQAKRIALDATAHYQSAGEFDQGQVVAIPGRCSGSG